MTPSHDPTDATSPPRPWPSRLRVPAILVLAALGAVLYGLHVQDTKLPWLAYFSTVPWVLLAAHPRLRGRGNGWAFFAMVWVMSLIGLWFLRGQNTVSWLLGPWFYFPLAMPAYFMTRIVTARWPRFPLAVLWPLAFTGTEWLRIRLSPGEISLCHLGYSQVTQSKLIQVADIGGVGFISFNLAAVAGLLAAAVTSFSLFPDARSRLRHLAPQAAVVALLYAFVLGYGFAQDTEKHFTTGPRFHVVQTNTLRSMDAEDVRRMYDLQVVQTLSSVPDGAVDAVLWPENSVLQPIYSDETGWHPFYAPDLRQLVSRLGVPLLIDSGWMLDGGPFGYHTAMLFEPGGDVQHYHKVRLLPWTEYVPLKGLFETLGEGALQGWLAFVERVIGFVPKAVHGPLDALQPMEVVDRQGREWLFGTPVCFEIATARVVNRWHRQGAHFLVNQTSEGRLGDSVHEQAISICGFRAIEARVSVVRATNDGISALIDPNGRVRQLLRGRYTGSPINEAGTFQPEVVLDDRRGTIYVRFGDWLPIGCLLVALALTGRAARDLLRRRRLREAA